MKGFSPYCLYTARTACTACAARTACTACTACTAQVIANDVVRLLVLPRDTWMAILVRA